MLAEIRLPAMRPTVFYNPTFDSEFRVIRFDGVCYIPSKDLHVLGISSPMMSYYRYRDCDISAMRRCRLSAASGANSYMIPESELRNLLLGLYATHFEAAPLLTWFETEVFPTMKHDSYQFPVKPAKQSKRAPRSTVSNSPAVIISVHADRSKTKLQDSRCRKDVKIVTNQLNILKKEQASYNTQASQLETRVSTCETTVSAVSGRTDKIQEKLESLTKQVTAQATLARTNMLAKVYVREFAQEQALKPAYDWASCNALACGIWCEVYQKLPERGFMNELIYPRSFLREHAKMIYGRRLPS